jgi:hypothetical protein
MALFRKIGSLMGLFIFGLGLEGSQEKLVMETLLRQLKDERTTDRAATQIRKLSVRDVDTRKLLARHLPEMIEQEPETHPRAWYNSVRLAGEFGVSEAIPPLAKWISVPGGSPNPTTFAQAYTLEHFPAGKALSLIGEPSVQTLSRILDAGTDRERWVSFRALILINSPSSLRAIRAHIPKETTRDLRLEMEHALGEDSKMPSQ